MLHKHVLSVHIVVVNVRYTICNLNYYYNPAFPFIAFEDFPMLVKDFYRCYFGKMGLLVRGKVEKSSFVAAIQDWFKIVNVENSEVILLKMFFLTISIYYISKLKLSL